MAIYVQRGMDDRPRGAFQGRASWRRCDPRRLAVWALVIGALACGACGVTDEATLPPDVQDPAILRTPTGALARFREALSELASVFDAMMITSGVLTDELATLPVPLTSSVLYGALDSRNLAETGNGPYVRLHTLRGQAREGRGFLTAYAPDSSPALVGHLYTVEAYADIFLADLFCSGIPLSTVDFDGDYTLAAGSTTEEVYTRALGLLDSALVLVGDSVRFQHVAAVGRGRALLALGRYAEAAAAVATVPNDYRYQLGFTRASAGFSTSALVLPDSARLMWYATRTTSATAGSVGREGAPSAADQEGGTGLNYRTSNDPRTLSVAKGRDISTPANDFFFPRKYTSSPATNANPTVSNPTLFTLADGVEARLIEAEAMLRTGDYTSWLAKLNDLRQMAWPTIVPATSSPLISLVDPGPDGDGGDDLRVDLLFRERAFWLYLTGHRQGDMRRLVRDYLRDPSTVYPTGFYPGGTGVYGTEMVIPVPKTERTLNSLYTGCFHHNA